MTMQSIKQLEKALDVSTKRVDELCAENERLRGLVRDLCARRDSLLDFSFYAEVAEQLGIEVDE